MKREFRISLFLSKFRRMITVRNLRMILLYGFIDRAQTLTQLKLINHSRRQSTFDSDNTNNESDPIDEYQLISIFQGKKHSCKFFYNAAQRECQAETSVSFDEA